MPRGKRSIPSQGHRSLQPGFEVRDYRAMDCAIGGKGLRFAALRGEDVLALHAEGPVANVVPGGVVRIQSDHVAVQAIHGQDRHSPVDARLQQCGVLRTQCRGTLPPHLGEPEESAEVVQVEPGLTRNVGQAPRGNPSQGLHLRDPVLERARTPPPQEVVSVLRVDLRDSVRVAQRPNGSVHRKTGELRATVGGSPSRARFIL